MTKNKALELRKVNEWSLSKLSRLLFSEKGVYVAPTTLNNFERGKMSFMNHLEKNWLICTEYRFLIWME